MIYKVLRIEGEYAYLLKTGGTPDDELFIAMALLPLGVDEGSLLKYENMEFSVL